VLPHQLGLTAVFPSPEALRLRGFGSHGENYAQHALVSATALSTDVAYLVGGVDEAFKCIWFSQVKTWSASL
jgi:hypothetical protein